FVRRKFVLSAGALDSARQFTRGERLLRAEKQRFDNLRKLHVNGAGKQAEPGRASNSGTNCILDRVGNSVRLAIYLRLFASFNQKPDLGLSAGITKEHSAITIQVVFRFAD